MAKARVWTPTTMFLLLFGPLASAQQLPDREYRPEVSRPAFTTGAGPTVCVDEAHNNFHTLDNRFWAFGELLRRDGFDVVANTEPFSQAALGRCRVLVISNAQLAGRGWATYPYPTPSGFTSAEIEAVRRWVEQGGSLLLIADHFPLAGVASDLAAAFDVTFTDGYAFAGYDESAGRPTGGQATFRTSDGSLRPHPIVEGRSPADTVRAVRTFTGQAFRAPASAEPLFVLGDGWISMMTRRASTFTPDTERIPVGGWLQAAVMRVGRGRAAFFGEAAMFSAQVSGPRRNPMGMNAPGAEQNHQFVRNLLHWLSGVI